MPINLDNVKKSYGRCMITREAKEQFFSHFYETFLNSHPEIGPMFANTDFDKQITMIKHAITMAIMFVERQDDLAKDILTRISKSHSHSRLNVKPEYYIFWVKSLIETLWVCDPQFNHDLEEDWKEILQITVDYVKSGYDQF